MARRPYRSSQRKSSPNFKELGLRCALLGAAFLIGPLFLGNSPIGQIVSSGLRPIAWLLLTIGAVAWIVSRVTKDPALSSSVHQKREVWRPSAQTQTDTFDTKPGDHWVPPTQPSPNAKTPYRQADVDASITELRTKARTWGPSVFTDIEWRRFEAVCEALLAQAGFETKSQSHGADGGVDIWLYHRDAAGPVDMVQCKHWQGKSVGVREVREFLGVMASHKLSCGTYATTSTFTPDAQKFAKDNGINAMDGKALLALIASRTPEQQTDLLAVAYQGEYWRPTCASCGIKLVERKPKNGGAAFWGCSNYPRCKSTLPMKTAMQG